MGVIFNIDVNFERIDDLQQNRFVGHYCFLGDNVPCPPLISRLVLTYFLYGYLLKLQKERFVRPCSSYLCIWFQVAILKSFDKL